MEGPSLKGCLLYTSIVLQDLNDAIQAQDYYLRAYKLGIELERYVFLGRICANLEARLVCSMWAMSWKTLLFTGEIMAFIRQKLLPDGR